MNPVLTTLRHFCDKGRADLLNPFVIGDHAYASSGHLLIRCEAKHAPELVGNPDLSDLPRVDMSRFNWHFMDDLRECAGLPMAERIESWVAPAPCGECAGYGSRVECPQCKEKRVEDCGVCGEMFWIGAPGGIVCDACNGTGYEKTSGETVAFKDIELSAFLVRRVLSVLPGAWWRVEDESAPDNHAGMTLAHFASGIFRGVLAPIVKVDPVVRTVKKRR